jgi:hypothetical protein
VVLDCFEFGTVVDVYFSRSVEVRAKFVHSIGIDYVHGDFECNEHSVPPQLTGDGDVGGGSRLARCCYRWWQHEVCTHGHEFHGRCVAERGQGLFNYGGGKSVEFVIHVELHEELANLRRDLSFEFVSYLNHKHDRTRSGAVGRSGHDFSGDGNGVRLQRPSELCIGESECAGAIGASGDDCLVECRQQPADIEIGKFVDLGHRVDAGNGQLFVVGGQSSVGHYDDFADEPHGTVGSAELGLEAAHVVDDIGGGWKLLAGILYIDVLADVFCDGQQCVCVSGGTDGGG